MTQSLGLLDRFLFALLNGLLRHSTLQICFEALAGCCLLLVAGPLSSVLNMIKEVLALRHFIIQQFWVLPAVFVFGIDVLTGTLLSASILCLFQNTLHEGFL